MKKSIKLFLISFLLISIIIPLIIHILFRIEASEDSFFIAKWTIGDILAYCGSILGNIIIVITVWLTIKSSNDDTRKTIEISQKQFTINLAIESIMKYANSLNFSNFEKVFYKNSSNATKANYEKAQDEISALKNKIKEAKNEVLFHLTDEEISYLNIYTKKSNTVFRLLDKSYSIFQKHIDLEAKLDENKINTADYENEYSNLTDQYIKLIKNMDKIVEDAHAELLEHLKIIIHERLNQDRINKKSFCYIKK